MEYPTLSLNAVLTSSKHCPEEGRSELVKKNFRRRSLDRWLKAGLPLTHQAQDKRHHR